jgi:hypothetical protein
MADTNIQHGRLEALPTELLKQIATYLDIPDLLRLRATFNRAVVAKTEDHYAKLVAKEFRNGVWLSPQTLRTLEAVGKNSMIAPLIEHIDFNVLYFDILNEWYEAVSSAKMKFQHSKFRDFLETQIYFLEHKDFEDVLGQILKALPALSGITTASSHFLVKQERNEHLKGLTTELQTLKDRYKLEQIHVPSGTAPKMQMELKLFHAAAKVQLQLKEVSICALPLDLFSYSNIFNNVERCYIFGIEEVFHNGAFSKRTEFNRFLGAIPRLQTLHLIVGFLKWNNIFSARPYSLLDWGHPADLSGIKWPVSLEELKIVHLKILPDKPTFLSTVPKSVMCEIVDAKKQAPSISLMRSEQMYNFDCFG